MKTLEVCKMILNKGERKCNSFSPIVTFYTDIICIDISFSVNISFFWMFMSLLLSAYHGNTKWGYKFASLDNQPLLMAKF